MISGHGSFRAYIKGIAKIENDSCIYCREVVYAAEHALFSYKMFDEVREQVVSELGRALIVNNMAEIITGSKRNWSICGLLMKRIMEIKACDKKGLEREIAETE